MRGPGKYDAEATLVRERTQAYGGVVVLVAGGNHGNGFSVQGSREFIEQLPLLLEYTAAQIRADLASKAAP